MSDQIDPKRPAFRGETSSQRQKRVEITEDVLKNLHPILVENDHDRIMRLASEVMQRIRSRIPMTIVADRRDVYTAVAKEFMREFHQWKHDDVVYVLCIMQTDAFMETFDL